LKEKEDSGLDQTQAGANKENIHREANKKAGGQAQEFSNPTAVLKLRMNRWIHNNREKKSLMDVYVRNVKIIEDAFSQITDATGIKNIEEIVTTFVKTEE